MVDHCYHVALYYATAGHELNRQKGATADDRFMAWLWIGRAVTYHRMSQ